MTVSVKIWASGLRKSALAVLGLCFALSAQAGLFDDEEARKAILELRQKLEAVRTETDQKLKEQARQLGDRSAEDAAVSRRGLLELQNQIEALKSELANLRGQNEQMAREVSNQARAVADVQRQQKDAGQAVEDRLRRFEPVSVNVDGREFQAEPAEKRDFEAALAIFRKGDFGPSQGAFLEFLKRYPQSGYAPSALFWLGNAQYATRDYKEAIVNFRALMAQAPTHSRSPEALLSIANCQIELKDTRAARRSLEDLAKNYPQSEAAVAGKERLARLR